MPQKVPKWTLRNSSTAWREVAVQTNKYGKPVKNATTARIRSIQAGTTAWNRNMSTTLPSVAFGVRYKPSGGISGLAYFAGKKSKYTVVKRGYDIGWDHNARYIQKSWKTSEGKRRYKRVIASKVAMWLEFGNRGQGQPARPYFKRSNDEFHPVLVDLLATKMHAHHLRVKNNPMKFRVTLTDKEISDIANAHKKILSDMLKNRGSRFTPNAKCTIKRKKEDGVPPVPLKWTGYLAKKLKIMPAGVDI